MSDFSNRDWNVATSTRPPGVVLPAPIVPTRGRLFLLGLPFGVSCGGRVSCISRNSPSRSTHCSNKGVLGTRMRVGSPSRAIKLAATTVLPNPVGAQSIPVSYSSSVWAASSWAGRSVPANFALMCLSTNRSSRIVYAAPDSSKRARRFSLQPRGKAMQPSRSSDRSMTRGFPQTDWCMACAR